MDFLENVKLEDLSQDQQDLVDVVGMEIFFDLVRICGGMTIYIPRSDSLERAGRNVAIKKEFTGDNLKALAIKYRLSANQIRYILKT